MAEQRHERALPRRLLPIGLLIPAVLAFFNAFTVAGNLSQTSDSTQGFVVGHAIAKGNVLLSGWHFPLDNFYFTDSLPYAVAEIIVGPRPRLMAVLPALAYAIFVFFACVACLEGRRSLFRNVEHIGAILLLLAVPTSIGSWNPILMSNMHTATVLSSTGVLVLCAGLTEARFGHGRRLTVTMIALALAVGFIVASDPFSLVFAFIPASAVLAAESFRRSRLQYAPWVLAVLVTATAGGLLLPLLVGNLGGFTVENDVAFGTAPIPQWWANLGAIVFGLLDLLGVRPPNVPATGSAMALVAIRCVAVVLVLAVFLRVVAAGREQIPLLDRLLRAGVIVVLVACLPSVQFAKGVRPGSGWNSLPPIRFLVPAVLFAALLTGRQISNLLDDVVVSRWRCFTSGALLFAAGLAIVLETSQALFAARSGWTAANPSFSAAQWLKQRGLFQGVGEYWSANLITAMSGNAVRVGSVVPGGARLVPYIWVQDRHFYRERPQFAVWQEPNETGVTEKLVRSTWHVCRLDRVHGYWIATLRTGLSSGLCPRASGETNVTNGIPFS